MRRFCRSIELCDDYLRGYYGLKLVGDNPYSVRYCSNASQASGKLLNTMPANRNTKSDASLPLPDIKTIEKLNETATSKLSEIVRRSTAGEPGWEGYEEASLIAARELLDRHSGSNTR